jgi:acetyl esterase/lipase
VTRDRSALHPDLRGVMLPAIPFHWRRALPLWRWVSGLARPVPRSGVEVEDRTEAGVRLRVYRPQAAASGGALLWLHGGGLIAGRPAMDDAKCIAWVRELGLVVVSPDYRLAPEHPFPAALDDAHAAWTWLLGGGSDGEVDPTRVVVGGASAGGGLAACLAQRLRDEGGRRPAAQLLVYPMLDDRTAARRDLDAAMHLVWPNRSNRAGWSAYLGREPGAAEAPAYAVAARAADLRGLPPAWIGVGTLDLFLDEDRAYAARLAAAGVATELHEVPGAPHGFDALAPDVPSPGRSLSARRRSCATTRRSTARPAAATAGRRRDACGAAKRLRRQA